MFTTHKWRGMSRAFSFSDGAIGMSQNTNAEDSRLQDANGGEQISPAVEHNSLVNTTGLTDEERARYEQVQAEINAMLLLEEEKRKRDLSAPAAQDLDDDLWLLL